MAKLEVPDSALNAIAGEEMERLRKEVKKLETKVARQDTLLKSRQAVHDRGREVYVRLTEFARELKEEFELYDWD